MNREIKFRAWEKKREFMVYQLPNRASLGRWDTERYASLEDVLFYHKEDFILMQYTGLKDKNGKEIYEGDIVQAEGNRGYENRVICYDTFQTKFKQVPLSTYHANAGHGGWSGYELRYYIEVVGNIYETPELLLPKATDPTESLSGAEAEQ